MSDDDAEFAPASRAPLELVWETSESPEPLGVLDTTPGLSQDTESHEPLGVVNSTPGPEGVRETSASNEPLGVVNSTHEPKPEDS